MMFFICLRTRLFLNICLATSCFSTLLTNEQKSQKRNFLHPSSISIVVEAGMRLRRSSESPPTPPRLPAPRPCGSAGLWWERFTAGMPMEAERVGVRPAGHMQRLPGNRGRSACCCGPEGLSG